MLDIHKRHINEEYIHYIVSFFRCDKLCPKTTVFSFRVCVCGEEMRSEKNKRAVDSTIFNVVWLHYQTHKWSPIIICLCSPMFFCISSKWCILVFVRIKNGSNMETYEERWFRRPGNKQTVAKCICKIYYIINIIVL